MGKRVTILAADPGTANFGYCILSAELELGKKPTNLKVLQFGKINCTVKSLTGTATTEAYMYFKSLDLLIEEFNPDFCIMERFQTRGIGGPTIELVSSMIGIAIAKFLSLGKPLKAVVASQWKVAAQRAGVDLQAIYDSHKASQGVSPHEVDSCFIALYGLHLIARCKPYDTSFSKLNQKIVLMSSKQVMLGDVVKRARRKRK